MATRIEPKVLLANERTYVSWMRMASVMGAIGSGLLAGASDHGSGQEAQGQVASGATGVARAAGLVLMPVAVLFALHAAYTYWSRNVKIQKRVYTDIANETVPLLLGGVLVVSLTSVLLLDIIMGDTISLK
ncbi:Vacuolar transporter chaperone 1 [Hondaea fermentalgiana]|uniref:Vacuolar transporter chaperone 1 n=1 Tax=Hondaea fermentalgiana TaxID=2315210 RepID=A0A2R5G8U1_9STRA|nr:Vacuolar transporter chaperone 1 [Hondaea fermentalgiana]|eukprot:GBG27472.1 Vacuolar transporter chaperone 1 [Hondaea fermentalgiana]